MKLLCDKHRNHPHQHTITLWPCIISQPAAMSPIDLCRVVRSSYASVVICPHLPTHRLLRHCHWGRASHVLRFPRRAILSFFFELCALGLLFASCFILLVGLHMPIHHAFCCWICFFSFLRADTHMRRPSPSLFLVLVAVRLCDFSFVVCRVSTRLYIYSFGVFFAADVYCRLCCL